MAMSVMQNCRGYLVANVLTCSALSVIKIWNDCTIRIFINLHSNLLYVHFITI